MKSSALKWSFYVTDDLVGPERLLLLFSYQVCIFPVGLVTDLKGHFVTQVAMGKAHTCVLMKNGEVWTFGVNNKGQCGRDTGAMNQGGKGRCLMCGY